MTDHPGSESNNSAREMAKLGRGEATRLLANVGRGRVVFTRGALPAIRPANHLVDAAQGDRAHPADRQRVYRRASLNCFRVTVAYQAA